MIEDQRPAGPAADAERRHPMLICHCRAVNDRLIKEHVRSGAQTVGHVGRATGAGTCCGGCVPAIRELLESTTRPLPVLGHGFDGDLDAVAAE